MPIDVYLEVGSKRVFAAAVDWPGWCRSGRDEEAALDALAAYGRRYADAIRRPAERLKLPKDPSGFRITERLPGNATTDFGAPGIAPAADDRPLREPEVKRQTAILRASWAAFDRAAAAAAGVTLRSGPRGGGRDLDQIVAHVADADIAYARKLGAASGTFDEDADVAGRTKQVRAAILQLVASRARGEPPPRTPRSGSLWTPRYAVRRSAWHALDHAWEIEDRSQPALG